MSGAWATFGSLVWAACSSLAAASDAVSLRLLGSIDIADGSEGFDEPSDLTRDPSSGILFSVSDDTQRIFALDLHGDLDLEKSVRAEADELEGLAFLGSGERLLATKEDTSEILTINAATGEIIERVALHHVPGFDLVSQDFPEDIDGKGLEGIAADPTSGRVYVIKEGRPRLLIELTQDLAAVTAHHRLTAEAGFAIEGVDDDDLDVSGIAYDAGRDRFWIVSDVGESVFLYDPDAGIASGIRLVFRAGDGLRPVKNAEGVALNAAGDILFVVTDDGNDSLLISYEILPSRR